MPIPVGGGMTRLDVAPIADPTHPETVAALGRYCIVCRARKGKPCVNPIDGGPPAGRVVHWARYTAATDTEPETPDKELK